MINDYRKIKKILLKELNLYDVLLENHGKNIKIIAIGNIFINISAVKRQQMIYKSIMSYFLENKIHAIIIKTYTIQEWNESKN